MVIICCKDHAELAIDIIVDEFETPPVVELLTENDELSTGCEYCDNKGAYKYRTYERLQDIALIVYMWISSGDNLFERKFSTSEYFNHFRREIKRKILKTRY